jgi:hypothetical protein
MFDWLKGHFFCLTGKSAAHSLFSNNALAIAAAADAGLGRRRIDGADQIAEQARIRVVDRWP